MGNVLSMDLNVLGDDVEKVGMVVNAAAIILPENPTSLSGNIPSPSHTGSERGHTVYQAPNSQNLALSRPLFCNSLGPSNLCRSHPTISLHTTAPAMCPAAAISRDSTDSRKRLVESLPESGCRNPHSSSRTCHSPAVRRRTLPGHFHLHE